MARLTAAFAALLAVAQLSTAASLPVVNWGNLALRQVDASQVKDSYDYVIVGGGQSGLVIAARLTEDRSKTALVIEYGDVVTTPAQYDPSSGTGAYPQPLLYNVTTTPQVHMNNRSIVVYAAATVGGGSTINSMMSDRAAPLDYDNWGAFTSGTSGWNFNGLLTYFRKSTWLKPPTPEMVREHGITYDVTAYGSNKSSPINLSYPTFGWPASRVLRKAIMEMGVKANVEQGYNAWGTVWYPLAIDPVTVKRSAAINEYYQPNSGRPNLHLLVHTRVNEIVWEDPTCTPLKAVGVTYQVRDTTPIKKVKAKREVILTAGWLHTPQILMRSGVGRKAHLTEAGIKTLIDAPGVGSNLQDHAVGGSRWTFTNDLKPNPSYLVNNATFIAWADELWNTNRTGPRSQSVGMVGAWLPLRNITSDYINIANSVKAQNATQYLPPNYTPAQVTGFLKQRELIVKSYLSDRAAQIELPWNGDSLFLFSLEHPLSRGQLTLNLTDLYADPIIEMNAFMNPVDPLLMVRTAQFIRRWTQTPTFSQLAPVEGDLSRPLQTDEELLGYYRDRAGVSSGHGCCTAAMSPKAWGGVVDETLVPYGTTHLSIGDTSVWPLQVATHTCMTTYATAEKAADIIKLRNLH